LRRPFFRRSFRAAAIAALLLVARGGRAEPLRFHQLTVESGLSNNWVHAILKDSAGFLWFGTHDGLNRYDGSQFTVYRSDPSDPETLPASFVGALYEDSQKRLWIGGAWSRAGLTLYDREHDRFKRFKPEHGAEDVRTILEDREHRLWVGTENGVSRFDVAKNTWTRYPLNPPARPVVAAPNVNSILQDRTGRLWVGTESGLFRFTPATGRYERWADAARDPLSLATTEVWQLHEMPDGSLWAATVGAGLQRFDPETGRVARYLPDPRDAASLSHRRVRTLASDGEGRLYVGTENGGLNVLEVASGRFTRYMPDLDDEDSPNAVSIWSLLLDDEHNLWVGTFNGGVNFASPLGGRFRLTRARPGGLSDPHVSAVLQDAEGDLWIGTDSGGLNRRDARTGRYRYYRYDPQDPHTIGSDAITALLSDGRGGVWVGAWNGGLAHLDAQTGRAVRYPRRPAPPGGDHVWALLALASGRLLVGTQQGADLFDPAAATFTPLSALYPAVGSGPVVAVAEDRNGDLWLCGYNFPGDATVLHVQPAARQVESYRPSEDARDGLAPGWGNAIHIDSSGNVWVGSAGGLSVRRAGASEFRHWTHADGLPDNAVTNIVEDDAGDLWVTTGRGLARLVGAVRAPDQPRIDTFDVRDGLQGYDFPRGAACRGRDGEMFVGGPRGLNAFFPRAIRKNPKPPRVVLTGMRIFNRPVRAGDPGSPLTRPLSDTESVSLSHADSMVTFEFAALNYFLPEKNQYAYRLLGLDRDWNYVGAQRSATYTNLAPGDYTLRVRASNNDGTWNEDGASLRVHVDPPFWGTWWFRALLGLGVTAIAASAYRLRVTRLQARARELTGLMEERHRLARELHDTLEQTLAGIRLQIGVVARHLGSPDKVAPNLELAQRMLVRCIDEARRTVLDLRTEALERTDLAGALSEQAREMTQSTPVKAEVTVSGARRRLDASTEHHLLRIGQEALTNALKHSGGDRVDVELAYTDQGMQLVVRDNGRGLPAEMDGTRRHFGLQGMQERVARLGGSLAVGNRPGGGVEVTVRIPAGGARG
jgi:signal transduction histidine kinase/ligand-binding sensor domain-containing protein